MATSKWLASIHGIDNFTPQLPLHHPEHGWISASYRDGTSRLVDLKTALMESHLIRELDAGHSAVTAALYRILISIAYDALRDEMGEEPYDWEDAQLRLLESNSGFGSDWVNQYFAKYEDRFYLLHSHFPFMQDPSLSTTFEPVLRSVKSSSEIDALREDLSKALSSVSQAHPLEPIASNGVTWGLPKDDIYADAKSVADKVQVVFSALMYQRYSHAAVRKGMRTFLVGDVTDSKNDDYPAAHAFRTALNFIVEGGSLYRTLLLAMEHRTTEQLEGDIPEWEWSVNPATGFLGLKGVKVDYTDLVQSLDAPRSSVNMTHMAMLFVPEFNTELNSIKVGSVRQLRRLTFNFKTFTATDAKGKVVKMPFPVSWNPFIARTLENKALKQVAGISEETALSNANIFKVALLPSTSKVIAPEPLKRVADEEIDAIIRDEASVRVLVHAGDPSQQKDYAQFAIATREVSPLQSQPHELVKMNSWIDAGNKLVQTLTSHLLKATGSKSSKAAMNTEAPETEFWASYYGLFMSNLGSEGITDIKTQLQDVNQMVLSIYDSYTQPFQQTQPLSVAQNRNKLRFAVHKEISER